jgi:hypothetical protein
MRFGSFNGTAATPATVFSFFFFFFREYEGFIPNISRLLRLRRFDRVNERTALRLVTKEATLWIASDGGNCWDICKDRGSVLPPVVTYRLFDNTK